VGAWVNDFYRFVVVPLALLRVGVAGHARLERVI